MRNNGKVRARLTQSVESIDCKSRSVFDRTPRCQLYAIWDKGRIIPNCVKQSCVNGRTCGPGVEREPHDNATRWAKKLGANDDQVDAVIEEIFHNTTIVSSGILPV